MAAEVAKLQKDNGVNTFGGCVPLLIQMPLLFAFFGMLRKAVAAFETGHHGSRVYAGAAGERAGDGRIGLSNVDELMKGGEEKTTSEDFLRNATNASEEVLVSY
jgi:hypothetical protein